MTYDNVVWITPKPGTVNNNFTLDCPFLDQPIHKLCLKRSFPPNGTCYNVGLKLAQSVLLRVNADLVSYISVFH